ncbi:type VI secretion system membrane subunit TssM [Polyangium mundeleinium]|uniref:Type VI secretion system membrane subunit TssM n=1 Tax=Polyangium mundeleinium TaxID=2995306 RepID=A0ABT5F5X5_9BACT|nr:type VI secretion system membrane subunit TssM [Polyangium mundeleinium]MDC0748495.1 type VI secretion system membrane subunit TssM [Polyangium mundeleinium]
MWWVLSALLALIVWALWYILKLPLWLPIVGTVLIVLVSVVRLLWNRIRASRAASALERAIAQQGAQQALNARPERRAEIQELQKQVQGGINALKTSKLGKNKKGGAAALYSLPWYVIIGPPGAGKTTALKHSGLVFPFADPRGGGVRGVGGTRNCDWWFTNEAILLDTAGRYTTEGDDHDEWISFLQMLKRYRSRKPINGVLVAISIAELIDASEQQIESTGKKLRARIDEVMTQLQMVVPVYVLFTKCDLIAGFIEFFGDIRKSDRAQAWGATVKLTENKSNPQQLFEREFDTLVQKVHARSLKRLAQERNREARERIYQFPLEFAGIKRNLTELVQTIFAVNAFQGTPLFRGFYFTSGTQEGRPLDRVLARMGHAMGIRPPETAAQQVTESKSYFLHDVFMNVVFPDGDVASRSAAEIKRQKIMRIAVSAAAFTLGLILSIPSIRSFAQNRELMFSTQERVETAMKINWGEGEPGPKLDQLDPVFNRLKELDQFRANLPLSYGWGMYRGEEIYRPAVTAYVALLQTGFVLPCKTKLEDRLKSAKGKQYLRERTDLKTYLMMSDVANLDVDWETGRLTGLWAEILKATNSTMPEYELKERLAKHVRYYLELVKDKKVLPLPADKALVENVRKTLQSVPVQDRYYELFVNSLNDERYDEAGDDRKENRKYPPLSLADLFVDRPNATKLIQSARYQKDKRFKDVEGPYTDKGHYIVVLNVANAEALLLSEQWVAPLGPDEAVDKIPTNLKRLSEDYDQRYIEQWSDFLADITITPPSTVKEALDLYNILLNTPYPYLQILRAVEDHTQWKKYKKGDGPSVNKDELNKMFNTKLQQQFSQKTGGLRITTNVDVTKMGERPSTVPPSFAALISFGVPPENTRPGQPITDTPLQKYLDSLTELRRVMQDIPAPPTSTDMINLSEQLSDVAKKVEAFLQPLDEKAKALLRPLLLNPLRISGTRIAAPGGGNYVDKPKERFPNPFRR